jgi:hypothetical protein
MERKLYTIEEVKKFVAEGRIMVLTGEHSLLEQLPKGKWIGGTIPYFMDHDTGKKSNDLIFVDDFTDLANDIKISIYNTDTIKNIAKNTYTNGFTMLLIPAFTDILSEFSLNSFSYENIFTNPVVGYVTGFDLEKENQTAKVFSGEDKQSYEQQAIALHIKLPENKLAQVEIVNIFSQDTNSPSIVFPKNGFEQDICTIDGKEQNLADYIINNNIDIKFPLIEEQNGALINKSFMKIDEQNKKVIFYAPIFKNREYKFAQKIENYIEKFNLAIKDIGKVDYACNCILNYLYGGLEGQKINLPGATTFGEIAYQLLNQTQIYLKILDK